jgi:hypothetical protein
MPAFGGKTKFTIISAKPSPAMVAARVANLVGGNNVEFH